MASHFLLNIDVAKLYDLFIVNIRIYILGDIIFTYLRIYVKRVKQKKCKFFYLCFLL